MAADKRVKELRPLRADARRNRDAILRAAREVFETEGVLASLDAIAVRAGVGNATLYRNFPTREDLLAAVMEASIAIAMDEAERLGRELAPRDAFAGWLVWLTWQLRLWHDLPQCVAAASGTAESSMSPPVASLMAATEHLLERARDAGAAVDTVTASEVFELVTALSWAVDRFGDDETAARRRVEVATAGLFTPSRGA
ncbi:MAG: helix-turn-helix domain containing protein [Azospirillaceae bacterium]|nr:helix-turn-helix domain containing protein [Azospirillaceae bacterium]